MTKHPVNKFERKKVSEKKSKQRDGQEQRREQKLYKKLTIEHLKEKENEDELRVFEKGVSIVE